MAGILKTLSVNQDSKKLIIRLLSITGALVACPLFATIVVRADLSVLGAIIAFAAFPLFFLALVMLLYTARRGVAVYGMTKMEAWWWSSVPHAATFWLYFRVLRLERFTAHLLGPFVLVFMISTVSTGVWTVVTICQLAFSKARNFTVKDSVMLGFALLLAVILWTISANRDG